MANGLELKPPLRIRIATALVVALIHIAAFYGLMRAFIPDLAADTIDRALTAFTVKLDPPAPKPEPVSDASQEEGATGRAARKAKPREVSAPQSQIPVRVQPVPPASSTGEENTSGAAMRGAGTGGAAMGASAGSGHGGSGQGGGAVRGVQKIAGDINSARDYPKSSRELRIGQSVTIVLTVGPDGLVRNCRVARPSPDAEADAITCRLATSRFRFRPALDAAGNPVTGKYAWRQRWFY